MGKRGRTSDQLRRAGSRDPRSIIWWACQDDPVVEVELGDARRLPRVFFVISYFVVMMQIQKKRALGGRQAGAL